MGLFKQMKDLKNVVAQAPGMVAQAQQTSAAAQAYAAQQQAAYGATGYTAANAFGAPVATGITPDDPRLAPIAGVDLTMYARISKAASQEGLDVNGLLLKAQSFGVSAEAWQEAAAGWPVRMRGDTQLAVHYGNIFGQV
ncbi:hypothetical protein GCM10010399_67550 [Dactylosporangium fulvum]|uniref:Uncharacterized protein n=1 Tax=Dactylosporangium fulvum TaxID=53359 RepID=A0ABY5VQN1_9ACTN|nr:hypothetical protein [Dactylosporangium fulvum]UWP78793.1 hypothetical protein Dfulv_26865 [Dactylosporangium fulvum]